MIQSALGTRLRLEMTLQRKVLSLLSSELTCLYSNHYESFQTFKNENFKLPKLNKRGSISTNMLRDSVKNIIFGGTE